MALKTELNISTGAKVLVIGSDIPGISSAHLTQALQSLDKYEAVVGPADDGGFYLLGLTSLPDDLLLGMTWSTSSVRRTLLQRLEARGLTVAPLTTLPSLLDIDYYQDLEQLLTTDQAP